MAAFSITLYYCAMWHTEICISRKNFYALIRGQMIKERNTLTPLMYTCFGKFTYMWKLKVHSTTDI